MRVDGQLWHGLKELAAHATGWPMDTLQLLAALILGCSLADARPWLVVLGLELANEFYDLWVERWPSLSMQLGEGLRDVLGTMLLPTLLLLVARHRPRLLAGRR